MRVSGPNSWLIHQDNSRTGARPPNDDRRSRGVSQTHGRRLTADSYLNPSIILGPGCASARPGFFAFWRRAFAICTRSKAWCCRLFTLPTAVTVRRDGADRPGPRAGGRKRSSSIAPPSNGSMKMPFGRPLRMLAVKTPASYMVSPPINEPTRVGIATQCQVIMYPRSDASALVPKEIIILDRNTNRAAIRVVGKFLVVVTRECNCWPK